MGGPTAKSATLRTDRARLLRRVALVLVLAGAAVGAIAWRGPSLHSFHSAFNGVEWSWVVAACALNLVSIAVRALGWQVVLHQALAPPRPTALNTLSAYSAGLLGNAVLPARMGEVVRVGILSRHAPGGRADTGRVAGSVLAHRVLDVVPMAALVIWVLAAAEVQPWLRTAALVSVLAAAGLLVVAVLAARHRHRPVADGLGRLSRLFLVVRQGFGILRAPGPALIGVLCQLVGWTAQLFVVDFSLRAFDLNLPLAASGLVLLMINVVLAFPLWPGGVGLFQAAVALALAPYGVASGLGFAAGVGLQAVELVMGMAAGIVLLAHEGISFAMLKDIERETEEAEQASA